MVADCVGLIKAFFWTSNGATEAKYAVNNCPDTTAGGMYRKCKVNGPINTIPATPGLVVWKDGHIGVSLDGVWAAEAYGFSKGVIKTRITDRTWTNWGQLPESMLDYIGEVIPVEPEKVETPNITGDCPYAEPTSNLKKGATGDGVRWIQWMLTKCGYSVGSAGIDGKFGSDTRSAVRSFQEDKKISVDGIVGSLTRAA
ncbi:MAG: peptidoglycan-binding protein [Clostridia bacterium]|nr:peptidoglycan-binding protein [Clostridia bacterium]MBQ8618606.1 peptidoglycan-binding protein [Clostridia bacterium]